MKSLSLCQCLFFFVCWLFLSLVPFFAHHFNNKTSGHFCSAESHQRGWAYCTLHDQQTVYINYKTWGWVKLWLFVFWLNTQPYFKLNVCKLRRLFFCLFFQTSFVDCLMEQTHPEIEGGYDVDVSASVTCISKAKHNTVGCHSLSVETWLTVLPPKNTVLEDTSRFGSFCSCCQHGVTSVIHHCGLLCFGIAFLRVGWGGGFINLDCIY